MVLYRMSERSYEGSSLFALPPFALFPSAFAKVGPQALLPAFDLEKPTQRDPLHRFSAVSSSASLRTDFLATLRNPLLKGGGPSQVLMIGGTRGGEENY